jgi:hypothetical protein
LPTLVYGCDALNIEKKDLDRVNSAQGSAIKGVLGIGKRSHHSNLLHALSLPSTKDVIAKNTLSFFNRIFKVSSPLRDLCTFFMSTYMSEGVVYQGTMVSKIIALGYSPVDVAFNLRKPMCHKPQDGVIESLEYLVYHENFIKPWGEEHVLVTLLTRYF